MLFITFLYVKGFVIKSFQIYDELVPLFAHDHSDAFNEKTAHRAANSCDNWRGTDRVGKTYSPSGRHF